MKPLKSTKTMLSRQKSIDNNIYPCLVLMLQRPLDNKNVVEISDGSLMWWQISYASGLFFRKNIKFESLPTKSTMNKNGGDFYTMRPT